MVNLHQLRFNPARNAASRLCGARRRRYGQRWKNLIYGEIPMKGIRGTMAVAALLAAAVTIGACAKDVPHSKMGLGASQVPAAKIVK